jgi:hypothetical protein
VVSPYLGTRALLPLQGREHGSFLVRLKECLPSRQQFIQELQDNADQHFELRVRRGQQHLLQWVVLCVFVLLSLFCQCFFGVVRRVWCMPQATRVTPRIARTLMA